jgi:hypothetical protein
VFVATFGDWTGLGVVASPPGRAFIDLCRVPFQGKVRSKADPLEDVAAAGEQLAGLGGGKAQLLSLVAFDPERAAVSPDVPAWWPRRPVGGNAASFRGTCPTCLLCGSSGSLLLLGGAPLGLLLPLAGDDALRDG